MKKYLKFIKKEKLTQLVLEDRKMPMTRISKIDNSLRFVQAGTYEAAKTSQPLTPNAAVVYFEAYIKNLSTRHEAGVGIIQKDCSMKRHPGESNMSIGYLNSGEVKIHGKKIKSISQYKTMSVVGVGVIYSKNQVFFTLDGKLIDTIPFEPNPATWSKFYPCTSLKGVGDQIELRFTNFQFNFEEMQNKIEKQCIQQIEKEAISNINIYSLVGDYLKFHGYNNTFNQLKKIHVVLDQQPFVTHPFNQNKLGFADASNSVIKPKKSVEQPEDELIMQRKCSTRQRIMSDYWGDINELPRKRICESQLLLVQSHRKNSVISNLSNQQIIDIKKKISSAQPEPNEGVINEVQTQKQKFLLQTRLTILKLITEEKIQAAQQLLENSLPKIFELFNFLKPYFQMHIYLRILKNDGPSKAVEYMRNQASKHKRLKQQSYPIYCKEENRLKFVSFTQMMGLISLKLGEKNDAITSEQFQAFSNYLNDLILKNMGLFSETKLDILVNHFKSVINKNEQFKINGLSFLCDI